MAFDTLLTAEPDYAWEVATLYPQQGAWTEDDYLALTDDTHRPIELADGRLEFLPMPTEIHQELLKFLFLALHQFVVGKNLGTVHFAGIRLRIRPGKIREPDVLFLKREHFHLRDNRVWNGADLVMEVVSDDPQDRQRDYEQKLADYAAAGVAEYWIIDFARQVVQIHRLVVGRYELHGEFARGEQATSYLLPDFCIDVATLFAAVEIHE